MCCLSDMVFNSYLADCLFDDVSNSVLVGKGGIACGWYGLFVDGQTMKVLFHEFVLPL